MHRTINFKFESHFQSVLFVLVPKVHQQFIHDDCQKNNSCGIELELAHCYCRNTLKKALFIILCDHDLIRHEMNVALEVVLMSMDRWQYVFVCNANMSMLNDVNECGQNYHVTWSTQSNTSQERERKKKQRITNNNWICNLIQSSGSFTETFRLSSLENYSQWKISNYAINIIERHFIIIIGIKSVGC